MTIVAQNRHLPDWFTRIRTRQIVLPRFQRYEAWDHENVSQLFNTILRQLPIGAVLILEIGNDQPFISRPIVGAPENGERITEYLLDGQQRLTALWRGLHNNYPERTYFVYLKEDEETHAPYYVGSVARYKKEGDTAVRPFWANGPQELWSRRMIPLDLCAPGDAANERYREWARAAISDADEREQAAEVRSKLRETFATFNLPYLSLPVTTKKETALDVFMKMNTSAAPLTTYDIVVAQVEAAMGQSLHDLVGALRNSSPNVDKYYPPEQLALYAGALLQERSPTNSTYLSATFGPSLLKSWEALKKGAKRAVTFLEEEKIFDSNRLPTDVVVPVLTALWAEAPDKLDAEGRARLILRKYLWRAFFSSRYENSSNSKALVDYSRLRKFLKEPSAPEPDIFDEAQYSMPQAEELIVAGWPKGRDRLARAILAVALHQGGHDLADGSTVSRENLPKREYHHLYPDAHLERQGIASAERFRSLNCALVTWQTNRNISDKAPEHYLAERLDGTEITRQAVEQRLETHLIPFEELVAGDYQAFLKKRATLIRREMLRLCQSTAT